MNDQLSDLLTRGVANIIPSAEALNTRLHSLPKLNVYFGIDPTSTNIHLGHAFPLRKLQTLLDLNHNITFLIGDFTALVGDTSDKESERPILTPQEIESNFKTYKTQAEKFLDFSKVKVVHNSEWLSELTFKELIHLTQQFSLNDFIGRELIKKRLDTGKHIRLDETLYPLMQGYDSYILDADLQLGGTDQTFNMQAGRTLLKNLKHKESFIIANEFLTGIDGRKMSKSWGNAILLTDTPEDIYGKIMSIKDELITEYFTLATNISLTEIDQIKKTLKEGYLKPLEAKKRLALQVTQELHNEVLAKQAEDHFESLYQKNKPEELSWNGPRVLTSLATTNILAPSLSNSEAKRLITQGSFKFNGEKITDPTMLISLKSGTVLSLGKHILKQIK